MKALIGPMLGILITFGASGHAFADMAFEFGRGPMKLTALNFDGLLTDRQQVVANFFSKDSRLLENFLCYEAELRDLENRKVRGMGIDCLLITPVVSTPLEGGLGNEHITPGLDMALSPQIEAVTFFFLPGGHFVVDGKTTVRPIFDGVGDGLDGKSNEGPFGRITHITGSFPGNVSNIVDASKRFAKLVGKGKARLSGAVNTDDFFIEPGNPMSFTCHFTISSQ